MPTPPHIHAAWRAPQKARQRCRASAAPKLPANLRGAILVQFALLGFVLLIILGAVQIGHMYYAKRDLQRIVDIAAIEGANAIVYGDGNSCEHAKEMTDKSIRAQLRLARESEDEVPEIKCGNWDHKKSDSSRFSESQNPVNAIQVKLTITSLQLVPFSGSREVSAQSISAQVAQPVVAFKVGSQLLNFDESSPLGSLLSVVGLSVDNLRLLDSDGLATANITPSGLLDLLGVDLGIGGLNLLSPNEVADLASVTLLNIIDASIAAIGKETANISLAALRAEILRLNLDDVVIPLWSTANENGLFASLGQSDDDPLAAAAQVQVGLGELLKTAISIASSGHAISIPGTQVLGDAVKVSLTIVEPPTIAVGPVDTQGKSAQIRSNIAIDTNGIPVLGGLLKFLGIRIHLPVAIDAVSGTATLTKISCQRMPPSADFRVDANIASITIGKASDRDLLKILGVTLLRGPISATILQNQPSNLSHLLADEYPKLTRKDTRYWEYWSAPNTLLLGDTLTSLTDALFALLGGIFSPPQLDPAWQGLETNYKISTNELLSQAYLDASAVNGFYNVANATALILNGQGTPDSSNYIAPLVSSNFTFNNAIPVSCALFVCPPSAWKTGTFSNAFYSYTSVPYSLLDIVGIPTLGNGYYSCAGLLSSLLSWNSCVKANLTTLLDKHPGYAPSNSSAITGPLRDASTEAVNCPGVLCTLLQPILKPIKWLLNGLGAKILSPLLDDVLGLELGRVNVEPLKIQCDTAQIVE